MGICCIKVINCISAILIKYDEINMTRLIGLGFELCSSIVVILRVTSLVKVIHEKIHRLVIIFQMSPLLGAFLSFRFLYSVLAFFVLCSLCSYTLNHISCIYILWYNLPVIKLLNFVKNKGVQLYLLIPWDTHLEMEIQQRKKRESNDEKVMMLIYFKVDIQDARVLEN